MVVQAITSAPSLLYSFFVPHILHLRPPRFPGTHNAKRRKMKAGNTYNTHSITGKPRPVSNTRRSHVVAISSVHEDTAEKPEKVRGKTSAPQSETVCNRTLLHELASPSLSLSSQGMCTFLPLVCFSNGRLLLHTNYTCPPHFSFIHLP